MCAYSLVASQETPPSDSTNLVLTLRIIRGKSAATQGGGKNVGRFRGLKGGRHDWTGSFRPRLVLHGSTFLLPLVRLFQKACLSLQAWQMMVCKNIRILYDYRNIIVYIPKKKV